MAIIHVFFTLFNTADKGWKLEWSKLSSLLFHVKKKVVVWVCFNTCCMWLISGGQKENLTNLDGVRIRNAELPLTFSNLIWYKTPFSLDSLEVQSNYDNQM